MSQKQAKVKHLLGSSLILEFVITDKSSGQSTRGPIKGTAAEHVAEPSHLLSLKELETVPSGI